MEPHVPWYRLYKIKGRTISDDREQKETIFVIADGMENAILRFRTNLESDAFYAVLDEVRRIAVDDDIWFPECCERALEKEQEAITEEREAIRRLQDLPH